ncbi:MAG: acetoin utilization protein acuB [Flavobacteriales bacterium]|nr:MAG: acetoin utilization protein acuB [Flavobacteriales bacterium]PIE48860.1 MAG: acetoin utilization protein acuB [Flavobacteriales bacterium]
MNTSDFLNKELEPLCLTDTISKAKDLFKLLSFTHLPIVENGTLVGLLAENDVKVIVDDTRTIEEFKYIYQSFFAYEKTNWLELLKIFALNNATIIPVITEKLSYLGYYELSDILHNFYSTPFLNQSGLVLVVSKDVTDYSFSQVCQIVEQNNAKLLGAFISNISEDLVEITIKISDHDLNNTIQSFRRYNYQIITNFKLDEYLNTLKDRSDYLQKFLDI